MPPPSNAASAVGAQSAPSRPSQPMTCARQWIASAVANAPVANAPANASGTRDEVVDGARDDERPEQPGDADGGRGQRQPRSGLALAQPHAGAEQAGREHARERGARALADPPARDGDGEQEREPGEDGDAAQPGEEAAADEVLEVALWAPRARAWPGRGGAAGGAGACGRRARSRRRGASPGARAPAPAGVRRGLPLVGRGVLPPGRRRAAAPASPLAPPAPRSGPRDHHRSSVDRWSIRPHTSLLTDGYQSCRPMVS